MGVPIVPPRESLKPPADGAGAVAILGETMERSTSASLATPNPGSLPSQAEAGPLSALARRVRHFDRTWIARTGWTRVPRNAIVAFIVQAGTRMAAALSYYAIFAAGPTLVLTIALGSLLFGGDETRDVVVQALQRLLPPSAAVVGTIAEQLVRTSAPATGLAAATGLFALVGFTRALATSLNVTLNEIGSEPMRRTFAIVPVLYLAVVGLIWGSWMLALLVRPAVASIPTEVMPHPRLVLSGIAPFVLAVMHFSVILALVPRARLAPIEIFVPAVVGAALWEGSRHLFGWLIGTDSFYLELFGALGGVVALLGWVYLSSIVLVLTGQIAWAFAMERRGRGELARKRPREAGLEEITSPFEQDNAVNEAQRL